MELVPIAEELWSLPRPLRFWGVETGTRMTVVRVGGGRLVLHSPVAPDPALRAAVDALGTVAAVIAPSRFHHLFVGPWLEAYPEALAFACPGLAEKRPDVPWHAVLTDEPHPLWRGELEQVWFGARALESEVVFFHRRSRTLVSSDVVFHLSAHPARLTRWVARALGNGAPGATWLERLMIRDRAAARAQIDRMLAWDVERILLAHGPPIEAGGREVLARAYAWL